MLTSQTKTFVSQVLLARRCIMCEVMYLPMAERYEVFAYAFPTAADVQLCQLLANCPNLCQLTSLIKFRHKCMLVTMTHILSNNFFFFFLILFVLMTCQAVSQENLFSNPRIEQGAVADEIR